MALTYSAFQTFAEVEHHYNAVKPLISKCHTKAEDIRPIGDRKRKWERIVKLSDYCYALVDGYCYGDSVFKAWGTDRTPTKADTEFYAAVVWRKYRDGTTSVKIRNGTGPWNHVSRYQFLSRHTPRGMYFLVSNGKQYVNLTSNYGDNDRHFLAKGKTVPKEVNPHWKNFMRHKDNTALAFKLTPDGKWLRDPETGEDLPTPPRVNKALKAKFKEPLREFFEWGMTIANMLPLTDNDYIRKMRTEAYDYYSETEGTGFIPRRPTRDTYNVKNCRSIITDPEHPLRLPLFVEFAETTADGWWQHASYKVQKVETKEDLSAIRNKYNNWVNKHLGFKS